MKCMYILQWPLVNEMYVYEKKDIVHVTKLLGICKAYCRYLGTILLKH